jgi:hypothetical protein
MLWGREKTTNVTWKLGPLLRHAWLARLPPTRIVISGSAMSALRQKRPVNN